MGRAIALTMPESEDTLETSARHWRSRDRGPLEIYGSAVQLNPTAPGSLRDLSQTIRQRAAEKDGHQ